MKPYLLPSVPLFVCRIGSLLFLFVAFAVAEVTQVSERLVHGNVQGLSVGSKLPKPWQMSSGIDSTDRLVAEIALRPSSENSEHWLRLVDDDPEQAVSIRQNFEPIQSGRLTMELYFERIGGALGIYLGSPNVATPATRIVDFKVLSRGRVSFGYDGERNTGGFAFSPGEVYPIYVDFKTSPDGKRVFYKVGIVGSDLIIGHSEVDAAVAIEGLRITTDRATTDVDIYLRNISLVEIQ